MIEFSHAEAIITPSWGLRLGGYMHRLGLEAIGVRDDLYVRLLRISSSSRNFVIAQLDLLGLYLEDVAKIRSIIGKTLGLKDEEIMVSTTHTHSAPETIIPMWPNTLPYSHDEKRRFDAWFDSVLEKIRESSEKLVELEKAHVYYSRTDTEGLCYNRASPEEPYDSSIPVLVIKGDTRTAILYSVPCHPVCNEDLYYSADYHGHVVMELSYSNFKAIPLTGPCGNVDPVKKGYDFAKSMGREIARRILLSLGKAVELGVRDVEFGLKRIKIPLRTLSLDVALERYKLAYERYSKIFHESRTKGAPDSRYFALFEELLYADQELEVAKKAQRDVVTEVQVLRVGEDLVLVSIPGELLSETAWTIEYLPVSKSFRDLIFTAYTNDYVGYIPPAKYFERGRYEARLALWSRVEQGAEEILVKTISELLGEVK